MDQMLMRSLLQDPEPAECLSLTLVSGRKHAMMPSRDVNLENATTYHMTLLIALGLHM